MHMCALCLIPKLGIQFGKRVLSHLVQEPISQVIPRQAWRKKNFIGLAYLYLYLSAYVSTQN